MGTCQYCRNEWCNGIQDLVIDPYLQEIHEEIEYVWLCPGEYQDRCDDI